LVTTLMTQPLLWREKKSILRLWLHRDMKFTCWVKFPASVRCNNHSGGLLFVCVSTLPSIQWEICYIHLCLCNVPFIPAFFFKQMKKLQALKLNKMRRCKQARFESEPKIWV
jgi:hypothetical protein